jgi:hypothetical protein
MKPPMKVGSASLIALTPTTLIVPNGGGEKPVMREESEVDLCGVRTGEQRKARTDEYLSES